MTHSLWLIMIHYQKVLRSRGKLHLNRENLYLCLFQRLKFHKTLSGYFPRDLGENHVILGRNPEIERYLDHLTNCQSIHWIIDHWIDFIYSGKRIFSFHSLIFCSTLTLISSLFVFFWKSKSCPKIFLFKFFFSENELFKSESFESK